MTPNAYDTIRWYHKLAAAPLQFLTSLNLGPFGGRNSISAVIEAVLALKKGQEVSYPLSKTDQFFVKQLANRQIPPAMIEYRELNHEAQKVVMEMRDDRPIGVIWLGAGVFSLDHPLLATRKGLDWHLWTDKHPIVVATAQNAFEATRPPHGTSPLSYEITLPQDVDRLNEWMKVMRIEVSRLVINAYGLFYALTPDENYSWISRLKLPKKVDVCFIFNSPAKKIPMIAATMAAFHRQRMVYYERQHIEALIERCIPGGEIIWEKNRTETQTKEWATWVVASTAKNRKAHKKASK